MSSTRALSLSPAFVPGRPFLPQLSTISLTFGWQRVPKLPAGESNTFDANQSDGVR